MIYLYNEIWPQNHNIYDYNNVRKCENDVLIWFYLYNDSKPQYLWQQHCKKNVKIMYWYDFIYIIRYDITTAIFMTTTTSGIYLILLGLFHAPNNWNAATLRYSYHFQKKKKKTHIPSSFLK